MALDQRQNASADGAEADQHDRTGDFAVVWPSRHEAQLPRKLLRRDKASVDVLIKSLSERRRRA
jgi:hypothetical protein